MLKRTEHLVHLSNAGVRRNGEWLVRGVDLTVSAGEIVTIIGPNGSGKSTTTKMALGILSADEGAVTTRASEYGGLRVGYVPQQVKVDWTLPLSVARFMQLTSKVGKKEVAAALENTGVSHLINSEIRTLSGGEFQRVLLARAIARKPDLLVLDEPVQGVDFSGQIALYDLIKEIRDTLGCGILLVSHDLHIVMAATDKVICLNGHVCCHGTPTAVASSEEYKSIFGQHTSAIAVYEHKHDHTHLEDGRVMHEDGSITDHCHSGDGHHGDHHHEHSHNSKNVGDK